METVETDYHSINDYLFQGRDNPVRLAIIGGGPGSFAGIAHPIAARLDGRFKIVAGVFSSTPAVSRKRAAVHGVTEDRAYGTIEELLEKERLLTDGAQAVAVITPSSGHYPLSKAALEAGYHVICEKPVTETVDEARHLAVLAKAQDLIFCVTQNYSGYPMIRQARQMIQNGELGDIRMIEAQFTLGLASKRDESQWDRKPWQFDISQQGRSWSMLEVGTHAEHLVRYVTGLNPVEVSAEIGAASPSWPTDDTTMAMVRYENGARGLMWYTFAASGGIHGLKIRVHGKYGGLEWRHEQPEHLIHTQVDASPRTLIRGEPGLSSLAQLGWRITRGHPEGFHEAFANIYRDFAEAIHAKLDGRELAPEFATYPTLEDGLRTLTFSEAAYRSAVDGGVWTQVERTPF